MKKILIIDANIQNLLLLSIELKLKGYEVETIPNCKEALQVIGSINPDMVLLNVIMPEMNGFEMLSKLREYSSLPVIVYSFNAQYKDHALKLGVADFLLKPFEINRLTEKSKLSLAKKDNAQYGSLLQFVRLSHVL